MQMCGCADEVDVQICKCADVQMIYPRAGAGHVYKVGLHGFTHFFNKTLVNTLISISYLLHYQMTLGLHFCCFWPGLRSAALINLPARNRVYFDKKRIEG
jgi:hypothetical protein